MQLNQHVRLNSGGPEMLIIGADDDNVTCQWMADGQPQRHTYPKACVYLVHWDGGGWSRTFEN